eukprot:scaffold84204_cov27-Cyclotella_meneghiniana.AAC.2
MQVNNRALLTMDNQPIGINLNLAFVPSSVASKIHELVLADDDGNTYHRIKDATDISPGKSVTLYTTHGDTISWDVSEESKNIVMIELANGKAWEKSSLCAACTATSVVADDSVLAALDDFHASIGLTKNIVIFGGHLLLGVIRTNHLILIPGEVFGDIYV